METQYNKKHGTKKRIYNTGDLVYAKNFRFNKSYQVPGEIIEKVGNVIYNTLINVGDSKILVRAHADQLRLRTPTEDTLQMENSQLPLDILLNDYQIASPVAMDNFVTPPTSPLCKPQRIVSRRQPVDPISRSPQAT
ncbi:uncharacterized protein LOC119603601 [Lucilia sericata]|uniref:uncharacterized protein LOC119603601 n=1 Tax=Lucilia sericata TaxID=13632 RepID=UPI0018A823A7|nr:uncharacterized protein LOC119603601 [Lucilia sericata]